MVKNQHPAAEPKRRAKRLKICRRQHGDNCTSMNCACPCHREKP